MMNAFTALLEARDPSHGRFRSYRLEVGTDFLGDWLVDVTYDRIGPPVRSVRHAVANEAEARKLVQESLRRRASTKHRIGVAYQFRQLNDPDQWFQVALG